MLLRLFEGLIPDDLENSLDGLVTYRLSRALVDVTLLGLEEGLRTATVENRPIDPSTVASSFIPAGQVLTSEVAVPEPLPPRVFDFERGIEFDLAAQRTFEDLLLRAHNDLFFQAGAGPGSSDDDRGLTAIAKKLTGAYRELRRRKNELVQSQLEPRSRRQLQKLMRDHGYVEARLHFRLRGMTLGEGLEVEQQVTETIRRTRELVTGDAQVAWGATPHIERRSEGGFPFFPILPHDVVELDLSLERTTGIRELVRAGLEGYEETAPLSQAGAARFGAAGAEGGRVLDRAVLRLLEDRFLAEEQVIPDGHFRHVFFRPDVPTAVLDRYRAQGTHEASVQLHPLETGTLHLDLWRDDDAAAAMPVLQLR